MKALLYLIALVCFFAELLILENSLFGFLTYSFLVAGILIALAKAEEIDDYFKLIVFLTIVPLARISEFFLDLGAWNLIAFYLIILFLSIFYIIRFKIKLFKDYNFLISPKQAYKTIFFKNGKRPNKLVIFRYSLKMAKRQPCG